MQPCGHASENPARQISLFCIPRLTIADDTRIAPIGGSSRAYHVVCIPTVMDRPKQHGVRGLHIYTEHAVPRTLAHAARCVEPAGADRVHATIPEADARCPAADT